MELIYFLNIFLDQKFEGRHRAVRGVVRSVLDRSELEEVRLHQPPCQTLPLSVYEGYVDILSPSHCYESPR